jgi:hypothetical protein
MLRGTITESLTVTKKGGLGIRRCMGFLEYADKYDMGEACTAVYESLKEILEHETSPNKSRHGTSKPSFESLQRTVLLGPSSQEAP